MVRPPKHCHGLALLVNHVINGRSNRWVRPQIACAPVSSPPPAARSAFLHIQLVCAVRLQGNHQSFRRAIGCGYNVNMIGSHMCGRQQPALQRADFYYCRENNLSTIFRQQVRLLAHMLRRPTFQRPVAFGQGGIKAILLSGHVPLATWQPVAVAIPSQQKSTSRRHRVSSTALPLKLSAKSGYPSLCSGFRLRPNAQK